MRVQHHNRNSIFMARPASLILLGFGLLSPLLTSNAFSQPVQNRALVDAPQATKAELIAAAAAIVRRSEELSRVWPGYWPKDQAFIINVDGVGALLISPGPKPASFEPIASDELPPELRGKAFLHKGTLAGAQRPFVIDFPIGQGKTAILVNARGPDASKTTPIMLHEQFHAYQAKAFTGRNQQFVSPLAVKDRVAFAAAAETERRILVDALSASSAKETRQFIQAYFALRREREHTVPAEVVKVEQNFERSEGTASYTENAALASLEGGAELKGLLIEHLNKPLATAGAYTTTWFRGRSYATGAALTYLIAKHDPGDWRAKIARDAKLDELLESFVGAVTAPKAAALAEAARKRLDYDATYQELGPTIRAAEAKEIRSVPEFLALGAYQVVFEPASNPGTKPGFSASNMFALDVTTMALPQVQVFNVADDGFSLTVRGKPMLLQPKRFTVLLPAFPEIAGLGTLAVGEHRLESLHMSAEGYELKVDVPVTVRVEPGRVVILMENRSASANTAQTGS